MARVCFRATVRHLRDTIRPMVVDQAGPVVPAEISREHYVALERDLVFPAELHVPL